MQCQHIVGKKKEKNLKFTSDIIYLYVYYFNQKILTISPPEIILFLRMVRNSRTLTPFLHILNSPK